MERVLNLPELISAIGFRLPQEDLYACTLVCRQWHDIIPILWHTIDDKTGSWADILRYHDDYSCHQGFDKHWLQGIFRKYGHHIRHLSAEWAAIIIAANESGVCTNLLSFKTDVDQKMTDKQLERNAQGPPPPPAFGGSTPAFGTFRPPFGNPDPSLHPSDPNFFSSFCEFWPPTTPFHPIPPYQPFSGATTQQLPSSGSSQTTSCAFSSFSQPAPPAPPAPSAFVPYQAAAASTLTITQSASTSSHSTSLTSTPPTASPPFVNLTSQPPVRPPNDDEASSK